MKKYLLIIYIILFFVPRVSLSEDLASQGFTGTMCSKFMKTEVTELNEA